MYFTDPVITVLSIITCAFLALVVYGRKRKVHPNYPPGPPRWPIIGNMHMIDVKRPYLTFHKLAETYGPIYSLQIGAQEMIVLCGYETVNDALVNHAEEFRDRPNVRAFMDLTEGYGVGFTSGNTWKVMRRFTVSALKDLGVGKRTLEDRIIEESNNLVKSLQVYKGNPFESNETINAVVANIIVSILLGYRFDYDDPKLHRLILLVNETFRIAGTPMAALYNAFPSLVRWLPGSHRKISANARELHDFITETFTRQRNELDVNDQRSFIDIFLVKQKEEKPNPSEFYFHDANLTALVADLFLAGVESTSATLQWALLLMMKYPEVQKNVQNEIEKVIGSGEPRLAHRKQLPYTDAVLHEIQRFANIGPLGVPHCTTEDVTLKGLFIPRGTHIIPLLHSVLRDKEYFKKPDEFYPQHFLDSDGNFVKNEAFLPFSAGKRICAGENLAKMELFLFFTTLLQNFTFQPPPGAKLDLTPAVGFTAHPLKHETCAVSRS
ncbi:cytochrome P450 2K6-like isoform X2 [Hyperolius riggenbachi]|uniref:cytochrome P450 2K6-like isoform X2 n=1 Tax=Hyperolius riggenbachi TaxID=752182 RepID=UPI0035A283FC